THKHTNTHNAPTVVYIHIITLFKIHLLSAFLSLSVCLSLCICLCLSLFFSLSPSSLPPSPTHTHTHTHIHTRKHMQTSRHSTAQRSPLLINILLMSVRPLPV